MKKILIFLLLLFPFIGYGQSISNQIFKDHQVEGSMTIYAYNKQRWLYSDSLDAIRETLPGATFNLINSCIALETGVIRTENELIKWEGKESDLKTAYRNATNWFYMELAKKIGRKDYLEFLKAFYYGNLNFAERSADFWNTGAFGISPKGQIEFLKRFSRQQMYLSPRTFRIGNELLNTEKTGDYTFVDQSSVVKSQGKDMAWYIGYVYNKTNAYYFATRIKKPTDKKIADFQKLARKITLSILKQNKIYPQ
ncbi:penicillin-binding transpeptidase domain-containing protein [Pedobacter caeni]|uniref:Beta-lactamase class D n=1 Tax=Pedobacter caeni TaxID=288992 RepID=A0A1M4W2H4_9SPHI|nr:penicillin-binding transpeptidase domain-containing protein [Pedobacter caeni]SHE75323.1 beta-lactamase class D [Pedobacter caeni]